MNIIPIIGPWLGGALAAIAAVFVSPLVALIALAGTVVIQQLVYTFVSPKIMANSVDIHPALTLIALMVGSALGGAMSGLMGSLVGMLAPSRWWPWPNRCSSTTSRKRPAGTWWPRTACSSRACRRTTRKSNPLSDATSPGVTTGSMKPIKLDDATLFGRKLPSCARRPMGR